MLLVTEIMMVTAENENYGAFDRNDTSHNTIFLYRETVL